MSNTVFQSQTIKVRVKDNGTLQSTTPVTLKNAIGQKRTLTELFDVQIVDPANSQILAYQANNNQWINRTATTIAGNTNQIVVANTNAFDFALSFPNTVSINQALVVGNGFTTNSSVTTIANGNFGTINVTSAYIANGIIVGGSAALRNIIPDANNAYTIGNSSFRYATLWLSGNTLYMGNVVFTDTATSLGLTTSNGSPISVSMGNTIVNGSLSVASSFQADSLAANTLTINRASNLVGNVAIGGTLRVAGNTEVVGNLQVTGTINRNPNINIILSGDVTGTGNATMDDLTSVTISINTTSQGNSIQLGVDTFGSYVSNIANGTGVFISNTAGGETEVPVIAIGQDVRTNSTVTFATANITGNLTVNGALTVANTTSVGNTTITGFANISSTANIGGILSARSDVTVNGALTVSNTAAIGNTTITGFANITSTANIGGVLNARSNVVVNGALTVANTAALGNTTITGFANVVGNLQITDTIAGNNMTLSGNLTVSGTTTYINTTALNVGDNIITLNADVLPATSPTENAGIEVNRGSQSNVQFLWDETNKYWSSGNTFVNGTATINTSISIGNSSVNVTSNSTTITANNITINGVLNATGSLEVATGSNGVILSIGNTVTVIGRISAGNNYTSLPTWTASAPTLAGGTTASGNVATLAVSATAIAVGGGGTGYTNGDIITVVGGTFTTAATLQVTANATTNVSAITLISSGDYSILPTNPVSVTGGTGTGATFNLSYGIGNTFNINVAGSGYVEPPTITLSGGGGANAAVFAAIGANTKIQSAGQSLTIVAPSGTNSAYFTDNLITVPGGGPNTGIVLGNMNMFAFLPAGGNRGNPAFRTTLPNSQTVLRVLPNGIPSTNDYTTQTQFEFFADDYFSNPNYWHNFRILAQSNRFVIDTARGANTQSPRPIVFDIGGQSTSNATNANFPAVLVLSANGKVGINTANPSAQLEVAGTANIQGLLTASTLTAGNTTINGFANINGNIALGNTTITGFANVSTTLNVAGNATVNGALVVNNTASVGNTTVTGFINATASVNSAIISVGTNFIANSVGITTTGFANVATTVSIGANVIANTTALFVGNSTVNTVITNANITSNGINANTLTSNLAVFNTSANVGANVQITTTGWSIGNATANVVANSSFVVFGAISNSGIAFYNAPNAYTITMRGSGDTNGGRLDAVSDYNMYFNMNAGTNRGFVFRAGNTTSIPVTQIDGIGNIWSLGNHYIGNSTVNSTITATTLSINAVSSNVATFNTSANVGANVQLTTSRLAIGNATVNTVITSSAITGNPTVAAGNTTVTGFVNATAGVNSAILSVGTAVIANSTGITTTGTANVSGNASFASLVSVGFNPFNAGTTLTLNKSVTGATTSIGLYNYGEVQADVVTYYGSRNNLQTAASATPWTLSNYYHYFANETVVGANNTVTNEYGFAVASTLGASASVTNAYGFRGHVTAGANRFNLFMDGTANNLLNGITSVNNAFFTGNTTITGFANVSTTLNVTGTATVNGALTVNNTASVGNTIVTGFANISSTANIGGALTARSTVTVNGALTVANTAALGNTTVTGDATVTANLTANNIRTIGSLQVDGDLTVSGNSIVINTTDLAISDNLIYLNEPETDTITSATSNGTAFIYTANNTLEVGMQVTISGINPAGYNAVANTITVANATHFAIANTTSPGAYVSGGTSTARVSTNPDIGIVGNYNDGTYRHTGFFRDATDGVWKVFDQYQPEPDGAFIDTSNNTFRIAAFQANATTLGTLATGNTTITGFANISSTANIGGVLTARSDVTVNGALTVSNTAALGNTTITGFANVSTSVNTALLTVGTSFIANTIGAYHTGTINAASHTVSTNFIANSTGITTTGFANVATTVSVGANVIANTTALFVGNSTVNTVITQNTLQVANAAGSTLLVAANGNIGIGNATPADKLSVFGTVAVTNSTANVINIAANGNIGIGYNSPNYKLRVGGSIAGDANDNYFGTLSGDYVDIGNLGATGSVYFDARGASSNVNVQIRAKGTADHIFLNQGGSTEVVRFTANGNVGVGTASPYDKFQVAHNSNTQGTVTLFNANNDTTAKTVLTLAANTTSMVLYQNAPNSVTGEWGMYSGSATMFKVSTNATSRFVISANGNVGIGNNVPTHLLRVEGTGSFSGTLQASTFDLGSNMFFGNSSGNPVLNFDSNDYLTYNKTNNQLSLFIGANAVLLSNATNLQVNSAANITSTLTLGGNTIFNGNTITYNGSNTSIAMRVLPDGVLSFEGGAGQLFSIANSLTGQIFAVNDISGIPSIEVYSNGQVNIAKFGGNVSIGTSTSTITVNGSVTFANTLTLANNLSVTGFVNATASVNSAVLSVGTSFIANTTGAYHTGTVNGAVLSVGTAVIANSVGITTTGFANVSTTVSVGANVIANTTALFVGNSTVNTSITQTTASFNSNSSAVALFVAANGNIGLGNATPTWKLHVMGSTRIENQYSQGGGSNFEVDSVGTQGGRFRITSDGTAGSPNANVGIGNTAPVHKLSVNGNAFIGSSLNVATTFASGNATITGFANVVGNLQVTDTIAGNNLTLSGNLTVSGTTTYINTTNLNVGDNIITLNADLGAVAPTENAGIEVNRGSSANVSFVWNETSDFWALGNTSVTGYVNATASVNSAILSVGTAVIANSTGITTTGFANVGTTISVGANVIANTTALFVGNSTVNTVITQNTLQVANATGTSFFVAANGNVGIGNNAPTAAPLVVERNADNNNATMLLRNTTTGTGALTTLRVTGDTAGAQLDIGVASNTYSGYGLIGANSAFILSKSVNGLGIFADNASSYLRFGAGGTSEHMRLNANGGLYVGTTGDQYGRQWMGIYNKNQNATTQLGVINANTGASAEARFSLITGTGNSFMDWGLSDAAGSPTSTIGFGTAVNTFRINITSASGAFRVANASVVAMHVSTANGNVGIGNSTPAQTLVVAGTANVSGNLAHGGLVMTTGTNVDQIYTATPSLTLNTNWQSTGVTSTNLANGTYVVQLLANDVAAGGTANNEYYSGMMSWYSADTNSTILDEIPLHRAGVNGSNNAIFLATQRTATANTSDLILMISSAANNSSSSTYTLKFRRMI